MSAYLANRILADPRIRVWTGSTVRQLGGDEALTSVVIASADGRSQRLDCRGLFCFIGAAPASEWMGGLSKDASGFVLTDSRLPAGTHNTPLPFRTSASHVFAVGDLRSGSTKRVATAVGEGTGAVSSVHTVLGS